MESKGVDGCPAYQLLRVSPRLRAIGFFAACHRPRILTTGRTAGAYRARRQIAAPTALLCIGGGRRADDRRADRTDESGNRQHLHEAGSPLGLNLRLGRIEVYPIVPLHQRIGNHQLVSGPTAIVRRGGATRVESERGPACGTAIRLCQAVFASGFGSGISRPSVRASSTHASMAS